MSEVIETNEHGVEQAKPKKEFYAYADESGIVEIRHSNDVEFTVQVVVGIANFIRGNLRDALTGQPPTLPQFLRDLADISERAAAAVAAQKESSGEAVVEPEFTIPKEQLQ